MKNPAIKLQSLRAFVTVYNTQSLTISARKLGISQPAVSQSIKHLASVLDDPLFYPRNRRMIPTEKAREVYPSIQSALQQLDQVFHPELKHHVRENQTVFRVLTSSYLETTFWPELFDRVSDKNVRVETNCIGNLTPEQAQSLTEQIKSNRYDLILHNEAHYFPDLQHKYIFKEPFVCVSNELKPDQYSKALSWEQFGQLNFIDIRNLNIQFYIPESHYMDYFSNIALSISEVGSAITAMRKNNLSCLVPLSYAREFCNNSDLRYTSLPEDFEQISVYMLWCQMNDTENRSWLRNEINRTLTYL